jgi:hypothetical protein
MRSNTALPMTLALLALSGGIVPRASAAPTLVQPGYSLAKVSTGAPASGIAPLAFRPGDPAHLYAARTSGVITRDDYDPANGRLSNARDVAATPWYVIQGLAFHGTDLYVSLNASPLSRLARFSDPDGGGVYRTRHDFVLSIPAGVHGINQLQIGGNTLYVGIGAARRKGDPAEEADGDPAQVSGPGSRQRRAAVGTPQAVILEQLERFSKQVMPAFKRA